MTTPRPRAELAARYFADDTLKCWVRNKGSNYDWLLLHAPTFNTLDLEYYVGHKPPPPPKRTITLTVNGREWALPEPIQGDEPCNYWYMSEANSIQSGRKDNDYYDNLRRRIKMNGGSIYATEADAQAWADFDKWCRGGGV